MSISPEVARRFAEQTGRSELIEEMEEESTRQITRLPSCVVVESSIVLEGKLIVLIIFGQF